MFALLHVDIYFDVISRAGAYVLDAAALLLSSPYFQIRFHSNFKYSFDIEQQSKDTCQCSHSAQYLLQLICQNLLVQGQLTTLGNQIRRLFNRCQYFFCSRYISSSLLISSKMNVASIPLSASISSEANRSLVDAIEKISVSGLNNYFEIFCQFFLIKNDFWRYFLVKK